MSNPSDQKGFSLVELLVVVVIIGIVTALAIPSLQKGIRSAENGTAFATLRSIAGSQVMHYSQRQRFARLTELQTMMGNGIGVTTGDRIVRGRYVFEMTPVNPTDAELVNEYVITATRTGTDDVTYKYELTQTGKITQFYPVGAAE